MKADVQISRIHKASPFNVKAWLNDVEGENAEDIYNSKEVQTAIDETYGNNLIVTVIDIEGRMDTEYHVAKKKVYKRSK